MSRNPIVTCPIVFHGSSRSSIRSVIWSIASSRLVVSSGSSVTSSVPDFVWIVMR